MGGDLVTTRSSLVMYCNTLTGIPSKPASFIVEEQRSLKHCRRMSNTDSMSLVVLHMVHAQLIAWNASDDCHWQ